MTAQVTDTQKASPTSAPGQGEQTQGCVPATPPHSWAAASRQPKAPLQPHQPGASSRPQPPTLPHPTQRPSHRPTSWLKPVALPKHLWAGGGRRGSRKVNPTGVVPTTTRCGQREHREVDSMLLESWCVFPSDPFLWCFKLCNKI